MKKQLFKIAMLFALVLTSICSYAATTERINVSDDGVEANLWTSNVIISMTPDGRFVAFVTRASNLVPGDTNNKDDIFVYDRANKKIKRVSVSSNGEQANDGSSSPSISDDGRYVTFRSNASNLVPNDSNGMISDIFLHDTQTGKTELVNVNNNGVQGNFGGLSPTISGDGRYIVYLSDATNLVPEVTNRYGQVYVYDRINKNTACVSLNSEGFPANSSCASVSISGNGRFVIFSSGATNLVPPLENSINLPFYIYDCVNKVMERVSIPDTGLPGYQYYYSSEPKINYDGSIIIFQSDMTNLVPGYNTRASRIYVYERETKKIETAQVDENGNNLFYISDIQTHWNVSGNGRYISFATAYPGYVSGDTNAVSDVIVYDRIKKITERLSLSYDNNEGNGQSIAGVMNYDGRYIAFLSTASNLVPNDTNGYSDLFVRDRKSIIVIANAGLDQIVEQTSPQGAAVILDGSASKVEGCSDAVVYEWTWNGGSASGVNPTVILPVGATTVTLKATACNTSATDEVIINVVDKRSPVIDVSPSSTILWPPNHKLVPITINGSAVDNESGIASVVITVTDEYGTYNQTITSGFGTTINLEAWREGTDKDGRVYTITATATDKAGNTSTAVTYVTVPHDMGK